MTDVLEVEVDGEPPPRRLPREQRPPSWGMPVAIAVLGALLLAVLLVVVAPALGRDDRGRSSASSPTTAVVPEPRDEILDAASEALSAWGRFAVTGDPAILAGHFDEKGPQYRQLLAEPARATATAPRGDNGYEVVTDGTVESWAEDHALVRAKVVWRRPGEADQRLNWRIELRPTPDGTWRVWTVRPATA